MLLTRTIMAAVMIALLLALTLWLEPIFMMAVIAVLGAIAVWELMHTVGGVKDWRLVAYPALTAVLIPVGFYFGLGDAAVRLALVFLMFTLFAEAVFTYGKPDPIRFNVVCTGLFAGVLIPFCMSALLQLRMEENGGLLVIMSFVITAVSDTGGYFGGMFFGKHKGVLKCSPNKSLEGFTGSFICGILGIMIFGLIVDKAVGIEVNYLLLLVYAALGNLTTQIGDLAFSVIKREHGIKDYGNLIPGHGGVLDRFDSIIFTAPLVYLLVSRFPAF